MLYVVAIIGLAVLMIVHEAGHYLMARRAGMRVTKFSVGFGPTFFKIQPIDGFFWLTAFGDRIRIKLRKHIPEKHGPTIYQVAMIPFLLAAALSLASAPEPKDAGVFHEPIEGRLPYFLKEDLTPIWKASPARELSALIREVSAPPGG